MASLSDSWTLGPLTVPNRVMLAPLAGIGNWFVRLQAKRYGAGMAVSEMVSSHAIFHGNERTCVEMLRIDPREWIVGGGEGRVGDAGSAGIGGLGREPAAGPVSIQLFGQDPAVMRVAARAVAQAGADVIDLNMGCPVPKVCKTGAGAALLDDPDVAVAVAKAAHEGSGLPVTVKLRSGRRPGDTSGFELAQRLVGEAGVAAIAFHPRSAAVHHKGVPDYEMAARLVQSLDAPVILTGGLADAESTLGAYRQTGASAVMLARGSLGNPWLFEQLLGSRTAEPTREEVLKELDWTIDCAIEHLGSQRATRYLRKFYPWYVARLGLERAQAKLLGESLQSAPTLEDARYTAALAAPPRAAIPA
ncbi:MAG TPA: tRNA-dihydrouridine synthase [Solirubrobacteraceae bacterium]|jgi:tRNA-dihydrouridine synthase B|nr:tRNA-dihydrouridine synthase [Solirubrobacteraceae bacterium]